MQLDVDSNNFKIIKYNIKTFSKHVDELASLLCSAQFSPDIIKLEETMLSNDKADQTVLLGYEALHVTRESSLSGGKSILYKKTYDAEVMNI